MTRHNAQAIAACRRPVAFLWLRQDGAAAVEFGLILPLLLAIWAGTLETAHAIDNWRKVTLLARTVVDLTSQGDTTNPIAASTMTDIFASSSAVLRPFNSANAKMVVTALEVNTTTSPLRPVVCSSIATSNATKRATGVATDLTIPLGFQTNGQRYLLAEVSMPYTPMLGASLVRLVGGINGAINLQVTLPWPTRGGQAYNSTYAEVILPGGSQCP